jgi:hypothetical protein
MMTSREKVQELQLISIPFKKFAKKMPHTIQKVRKKIAPHHTKKLPHSSFFLQKNCQPVSDFTTFPIPYLNFVEP